MQSGTLVEFLQKSDLMVGVCILTNPQHVRILAENNKELNLHERKILHVLKRTLPPSMNRMDRVAALKEWAGKFENAPKLDLHTLWEVLADERESLDLETLAGMYFSDPSDLDRSTLLRALVADRIYFERKGGDEGFIPRTTENVNQIQAMMRREEEKRQGRQALIRWIATCEKAPGPPPEGAQATLPLIQDVAVMGRRSGHFQVVSQFFDEAGVGGASLEDRCLRLLTRSGIWDEDINLSLIEMQVPLQFSRDLLESVAEIASVSADCPNNRKDLRYLETLTIDDAETTDIDDALSWETTETGFRLWVHIADASTYVVPDTPLDQEASRRFTSIYLCERKIEMLPPHLSQNICSLVAGEPRLALSVAFELNPSFEVQKASIHETLIEVKQRMSYDEVDQNLDAQPLLQTLLQLATHHREQRLARGAVEFNRPELRIKVNAEKEILLKQVERDSPAQLLVSELMILANHWVAKLLAEARVPLIYKTQDAPTEENAQGRPLLKRAEMTVRPGAHYGLGLDVYTQFTSPIRRYNDLILHRQIKHWLHTQTNLYNEEQIQQLIALSDQAVFSANFIQRENYRYWLYKYFQSLPTPRIFRARVVSISPEKTFVHLPDFCLDTLFPAGDALDLHEGSEFWLEISQAIPRKGLLQLRRVSAPPEASPTEMASSQPV